MDSNNNQRRKQMNAVTVEQVKRIADEGKQAADGSFSEGSLQHQYAAQYIEKFLTTFDDISHRTDEPEYSEFCAAAINALRDIQVRDYVLGIINADNVSTIKRALSNLAEVTPEEYSAPVDTLLALTYYELDNTDTALEILEGVKEYSLATLLTRVFQAGWPKEAFQNMREELHPKVVSTIFPDKE
jgi:hypothetical protein